MRSSWKIALSGSCVAVIVGGAIGWQVYKTKANERKLAEDVRAYRSSAEKGDAKAQAELGHLYSHGQGVPQDYSEAVLWYRKGAEQGEARAENGLAYMYLHGLAVSQDFGEAIRWYRKAADQGYMKAESGLAWMYSHGQGVPQDDAEAVLWYRKAADQGYAKAQYNLGTFYNYGRGVPRDRAEARLWYRKAADQGDDFAQRALSVPLTIFTKVALLLEFLGSILLLDILPVKSPMLGESLLAFRQTATNGAGLLGIFVVGLSLYGYTHHLIRCLSCGLNAFTIFRWLFIAVWLALLIKGLRSGKKFGLRQDKIDSSDIAARG